MSLNGDPPDKFRYTSAAYKHPALPWCAVAMLLIKHHEAVLTLTVGNGNETMPEDSALVNESGTANDDKPVVDESWF